MRFFVGKIHTGKRVKIPAGLGSFIFIGKKQRIRLDENGNIAGAPVDWGETRKLWRENEKAREEKQFIYHLNEHTNGYIYQLRWSHKRGKGRYKLLYVFKPARALKTTLSKFLRENTYEYETQD